MNNELNISVKCITNILYRSSRCSFVNKILFDTTTLLLSLIITTVVILIVLLCTYINIFI